MKALSKKQLERLVRSDVLRHLRSTYRLPPQLTSADNELARLMRLIDPAWKNAQVLSSARQDWMTPLYVLDILRKVAPLALDPCASPRAFVKAWVEFYGPPCGFDGLVESWQVPEGTQVFANPPYGRKLRKWIEKAMREFLLHGSSITLLIPSRTGTSYWDDFIWKSASAICFWNGGVNHPSRITFIDADTLKPARAGATFDAAFVHWSHTPNRFCEVFRQYGRTELLVHR